MTKLRFEEFGLSKETLSAVKDMGFEEASPIQSEAIPILLSGKDLIGQAQTGTGKTAAFAIPVIEKLDHSFMVNIEDKIVLEFLDKMNSKKVVVGFNSTAENICNYLLSEIKKCELPQNILSIKIRVYETQFDYAEETARLS